MVVADDLAAIRALAGRDLGTSGWHGITWQRVDALAAATGDFTAIHIIHYRPPPPEGGAGRPSP